MLFCEMDTIPKRKSNIELTLPFAFKGEDKKKMYKYLSKFSKNIDK